MLPVLADALPGTQIVVRPHPSESLERWQGLASRHPCLHTSHRGNVLPWLVAARAVVHNGSSVGVEAAALGRPVVSYMPVVDERYDVALPNELSVPASSLPELVELVRGCVEGEAPGPAPRPLDVLKPHVAALEGRLASERIVDVLEEAGYLAGPVRRRNPLFAVKGRINSIGRRWLKERDALVDGHPRSSAHHRHRFPPVSASELQMRVSRLGQALGPPDRFERVFVTEFAEDLFEVNASGRDV